MSTSITEQNVFTDWTLVPDVGMIEVYGTGVMTLTLQYKTTDGNVLDTGDKIYSQGLYQFNGNNGIYRFGCKTGEYTSGTMTVGISQGS